eukprot:TRINITY_DN22661_c0_g1_i2.p1 TRINITY_DN22661_c0_g1~~TRINITY_DN22661_c0_g1_i2.p1  ORF type:complete len:238 (+),score=35.52 TRINITY_DN22661_c0_g1_i2:317-1030(+)
MTELEMVLPALQPLDDPWKRTLTCKDSEDAFRTEMLPYVTPLGYRSHAFVPRPRGWCGGAAQCGRIVSDRVLDEVALREADRFEEVENGESTLGRWTGVENIRAFAAQEFGVPAASLALAGGHFGKPIGQPKMVPCWLHSDYLARPGTFFFTAITYLTSQGDSNGCEGCETAFVDRVGKAKRNGSRDATHGLAVQPRRGRVLVFSSGVENLHCKLGHTGERRVVVLYFRCMDAAAEL